MELDADDRDYDVYTELMSDDPVVEAKYQDIERFLRPGLIVDDGCGDGALLCRIAEDHPDSALVGVDLSGEMLDRAEHRIRLQGHQDAVIGLEQHDMTRAVPRFGRADTIISSSTTHELWSYGDGDEELVDYYRAKCAELEQGGRFIIRDVIAPNSPDEDIHLWLDADDGSNDDIYAVFDDPDERTAHLDGLSTRARFHRFNRDVTGRDVAGKQDHTCHDGRMLYRMARRDAAEYLLTKDYTDNWDSEMQESFTHWTVDDHVAALEAACFDIVHANAYTSDWIRDNRFDGTAALYADAGDGLARTDYPPTNAVIVAEKRITEVP